LGVACLIVLFAVAGVTDYAAIHATPPSGWRGDIVLVLALLSAGALAALSLNRAVASGPAVALTSGAGSAVAMYLLVRLLFDLSGMVQPLWWSVPLLLVGAALAVV